MQALAVKSPALTAVRWVIPLLQQLSLSRAVVRHSLIQRAVPVNLAVVDANGGLHAGSGHLQHPGGWVEALLQQWHPLDALQPPSCEGPVGLYVIISWSNPTMRLPDALLHEKVEAAKL